MTPEDSESDGAEVEVTQIAGSSYHAKGCGKKAVYDCAAGNTIVCLPEGAGGR